MFKHQNGLCFFILFLLLFALTSCGGATPNSWDVVTQTPTVTSTVVPTSTMTLPPSPTATQTATATLPPEMRGPDAYFEYLAPIRMRDFQNAYNEVSRRTSAIASNPALFHDMAYLREVSAWLDNLSSASLKLAQVGEDVKSLTKGDPVRYAAVSEKFIAIGKSIDVLFNDYAVQFILYGRDDASFKVVIQDMKNVANIYGEALTSWTTAGGPTP